jgi:L-ascorbate metabolism protein UlaG (beta-lactamase superfamily)
VRGSGNWRVNRSKGDVIVKKICSVIPLLVAVPVIAVTGQRDFQTDVIETSAGDLVITFIGHATLMFTFDGKVIHVDPVSQEADYSEMPKADIILVTHEHGDHCDPEAIKVLSKPRSDVVVNGGCGDRIGGGTVMKNGDIGTFQGIEVEAVPAYNLVHERSPGQPYHPRGQGNGYIVTFGGTRVYVAGDTENTPEMKALKDIDIAFLPMNVPYTMTPEMVADAARAFKPRVLYPYHYGATDTTELARLLENEKGVEIRIREM